MAQTPELSSPQDYNDAMERALKYLGPRARSGAEVASYLRKAGHLGENVELVLARLEELSILDDGQYALDAARQSLAGGRGAAAVLRALSAKGVPDGVAGAAVSEIFGDTDEEGLILEAASRRAVKLKGLPYETQHRRLADYLVRRGHDPDVIHSVCRRVLEDFARSD